LKRTDLQDLISSGGKGSTCVAACIDSGPIPVLVLTSEIPLFPPVIISLPDFRMCDASHDDVMMMMMLLLLLLMMMMMMMMSFALQLIRRGERWDLTCAVYLLLEIPNFSQTPNS